MVVSGVCGDVFLADGTLVFVRDGGFGAFSEEEEFGIVDHLHVWACEVACVYVKSVEVLG